MKRVNKTQGNLQWIWDDLDMACGSLDNVIEALSRMVDLPCDIVDEFESIDISKIVVLKNKIETLLD